MLPFVATEGEIVPKFGATSMIKTTVQYPNNNTKLSADNIL